MGKMLMEKGENHFAWLSLLLLIVFFSKDLVQSHQDQSGFISIDCGLPANSTYVDPITGITYISDASFIDTGVSKEISTQGPNKQLWHLRSFPKGIRNCYSLNVPRGQRYLIRVRFAYGNYDNKNEIPNFDLYLGVSYWFTITPYSIYDDDYYLEMIHVVSTDNLQLCLVNNGNGAPFVSAIELRPMPKNIYETSADNQSLLSLDRTDSGNFVDELTPPITRYGIGDIYDRYWPPESSGMSNSHNIIKTSLPVDNALIDSYHIPSTVMMTALVPKEAFQPLDFFMRNYYGKHSIHPMYLYLYFYFSEIEQLQPNQSRVFSIFSWSSEDDYPPLPYKWTTVTPKYLSSNVTVITSEVSKNKSVEYTFTLERDEDSTLVPLINAFEAYVVTNMPDSQTEEQDVDAMMSLKLVYKVTSRNWQGDPCAPEAFKWDGVNCSFDASNTSNIIYLNLSSAELTGNISPYISNLKSLQVLDISYNNLIGPVPDFLVDMPFLKVINLSGNNLKGSVPAKLLKKSKNRSLSLSLDGNPHLCQNEGCNNVQKKKVFAIVGIAVGSLLIISFIVVIAIFWHRRNPKLGPVEANISCPRITYSEIANVTENFKTVIGEGRSGKVYLGKLEDSKVAVKMLSPSSVQGYKEFQSEAELVTRVHHKNLVSLVGYCNEGHNLGLIYEYMALGNLRKNLTETENILTWEQRLQIARDAAHGLDHLHRGPTLPMIHRNVKSSNILITEQFNGKVSDFGLSRTSPLTGGSHETTAIAGTRGYLDPEYFTTNSLNEKSDVYSFGIVLMEIVTCQSVIGCSPEDHIIPYVNRMVSTGDISRIIDPRLQGKADVNCVRRVLELAEDCVAQESSGRPNMNQVAMELEECLASMIIRSP